MGKKKTGAIREFLADRFADTWRLLSETTSFLSRTPAFPHYEEQLRFWRRDLQNAPGNSERARRIRGEITGLRGSLRRQGYDLGLARQNLVIEGFRNDAAIAEGFRRAVIFFAEDTIYWLAGEDNHITLAELLERRMETIYRQKSLTIRSKHYLWYRRRGGDLVLSGSDTETKEDFERLKSMAEANSLIILAKLKGLR
ncbi:MAG: hypothetical protein LBG84_07875 [Treponema sp.]|jgi:hypothetical protein|nr:hypothetical protein [Treponema sp.]